MGERLSKLSLPEVFCFVSRWKNGFRWAWLLVKISYVSRCEDYVRVMRSWSSFLATAPPVDRRSLFHSAIQSESDFEFCVCWVVGSSSLLGRFYFKG